MADLNDLTTNVNIWDDAKTKSVSVITDGSDERLAVDAKLSESGLTFQLSAYTPVVTFDSAGTALTTAWTTLLNVTGTAGKLDFIASFVNTSNYKIRLTVDASVIFTISMGDLNAIGLTNAVNVNIWAENANKNFRYRPLDTIDFTDSLKIEAAMTTGSDTIYWLINHRIQA